MKCPAKNSELIISLTEDTNNSIEAVDIWRKLNAFEVIPSNATHPFEYTLKGEESVLYKKLLASSGTKKMAVKLMGYAYSKEFKDAWGDWTKGESTIPLYETGEPTKEALFRNPIEPLSKDRIENLVRHNDYMVKGFTGSQLDEAITVMIGSLYSPKILDENGAIYNPNGLDDTILTNLAIALDKLEILRDRRVSEGAEEVELKKIDESIDRVLDLSEDENFGKFMFLIKSNLVSLGFKEVKATKDDFDSYLASEILKEENRSNDDIVSNNLLTEDETTNDENKVVNHVFKNDISKMSVTLSQSVQSRFKLWIAQMKQVDSEGREVMSSIGMPLQYDGNTMLVKAVNQLAGSTGDIFEYIKSLKNSGDLGLMALADRLNDDNEPNINQIRAMAKNSFDRQQQEMYTYKWERLKDGTIEVRKILTNRSKGKILIVEDIEDNWRQKAVKEEDGFIILDDKIGISMENLNEYTKQIKEIQDTLRIGLAGEVSNYKTFLASAAHSTSNALKIMGIDLEAKQILKLLNNPDAYFSRSVRYRTSSNTRNVSVVNLYDLISNDSRNIFGALAVKPTGSKFVKQGSSNKEFYLLTNTGILNTNQVREILAELIIDQKGLGEVATTTDSFGNQVSTTNPPSMLTKTIDRLHSNQDKLLTQLRNDPFSKFSTWLNKMSSKDGTPIPNEVAKLRYELLDAVKQQMNKNKGNAKSKEDMNDEELLKTALFMLSSDSTGNTFNFMPLLFSDKLRQLVLNAPKLDTSKIKYTTSFVNGEIQVKLRDITNKDVKDFIASFFVNDLTRMKHIDDLIAEHGEKEIRQRLGDQLIDGYKYFYFAPSLNENVEVQTAIKEGTLQSLLTVDSEGKSIWNTLEAEAIKHVEAEINDFIKQMINLNAATLVVDPTDGTLKSGTVNDVDSNYLKKINVARFKDKNGNVIDKAELAMEQISRVATDFAVNYMSGNINFAQIIGGDPAECYKEKGPIGKDTMRATWDEYFKRLAGNIGTSYKGQYRYKDSKGNIIDNTEYEQWIVKDIKSNRYIEEYLALGVNYKDVKVTDGFEVTTLLEHITTLQAHGKVSDKIYDQIRKKIETAYKGDGKYKLTEEEKVVLISLKPLSAGRQQDGYSSILRNHYVKTSAFPLIEGFTGGTELEVLRIAMEQREAKNFRESKDGKRVNVRTVFISGIKIGARNVVDPFKYDSKGNLESIDKSILDNIQGNRLSREHFGIQTEESDNDSFETLTMSQVNKLLFIGLLSDTNNIADFTFYHDGKNISGKQLQLKKEAIRKRMINIQSEKLHGRLGIVNGRVEDSVKFFEALKDAAASNGFSTNELAAIEVSKITGKIKIPLSLSSGYNRLQAVIMSMVSKSVTKIKMPGTSYIQVPSPAFKHIKLADTNKSEILFTESYTGKLNYFEKDEANKQVNGRAYKPIQVILPWPFKGLDGKPLDKSKFTKVIKDPESGQDRTVIDFDKLPKDLLQTLASRVPSQSHSSMIPIEVVGFLPSEMHDMVILPDEITTQTGSDFDIDHLYTYFKNYYEDEAGLLHMTGKEKSKEFERLQNEYIDLHLDVLLNKKVLPKVLAPLDMDDLKDHAKYIKKHQESNTKRPYYTPIGYSHIVNEYKSNQAGKIGVAIQAVASTFLATIEGKNIEINRDAILVGGKVLYKLGYGHYMNGKRSNADAINMIMSEAVDNAKNKFLSYLGYNKYNAGVFNTLLMLTDKDNTTLSPEFIANMMNQPVMTELIDLFKERENQFAQRIKANEEGNKEYQEVLKEKDIIVQLIAKYETKVGSGNLNKELVDSDMRDIIENGISANSNETQLAVLRLFGEVYPLSMEIRNVTKAINIDTNGVGKNPFESLNKERVIKNSVLGSPMFKNIDSILTNDDGNSTEVGAIYKLGLQTANEIITNVPLSGQALTIFQHPTWLELLKEVKNQGGYLNNVPVKIQLDLFKALKAYIYTTKSIVTNGTVVDNPLLNYQVPLELREKLFQVGKDKTALSDMLKNYLADEKNVAGRFFLEALNIKSPKGNRGVVSIEFNYNKLQTGTEQKLIGSFIELATGNTEQQGLALQLTSAAYLTGGTFNPKSYVTILPITYLEELGFTNYLSNFDIGSIKANDFLEQYYSHEGGVKPYKFDKMTTYGSGGNPQVLIASVVTEKNGQDELEIVEPKEFGTYSKKLYRYEGRDSENMYFRRVTERGNGKTNVEYDGSEDTNPASVYIKDVVDNYKIKEYLSKLNLRKIDSGIVIGNSARQETIVKKLFGKELGSQLDKTDLENMLVKLSKSQSMYKYLAQVLAKHANKMPSNVRVKITEGTANGDKGTFDTLSNVIEIFPDNHTTNNFIDLRETLLHETVHAMTSDIAKQYIAGTIVKNESNTSMLLALGALKKTFDQLNKQYKAEVDSYYRELKKGIGRDMTDLAKWQPLTSFSEFMVSITNKDFLNAISDFKSDLNIFDRLKNQFKTFFENFFRALGIDPNNTGALIVVKRTLNLIKTLPIQDTAIRSESSTAENIKVIEYGGKKYEIDSTTLEVFGKNGEVTGGLVTKILLEYGKKNKLVTDINLNGVGGGDAGITFSVMNIQGNPKVFYSKGGNSDSYPSVELNENPNYQNEVKEVLDIYNQRISGKIEKDNKKREIKQEPKQGNLFEHFITNYYEGDIKPELNTVFVFGSNPVGINGNPERGTGGAALVASKLFGVKQGEKMDNKLSESGNAYGLTTVTYPGRKLSMTPNQITEGIKKLYKVARQNSSKQFKIAYRNTTVGSLNGYTGLQMIDMFNDAGERPNNIVFSKEWVDTGKIKQSNLFETTQLDKFQEADRLTPIEQNYTDNGTMQEKFRGKSTMDLIISGDRTRTTRANTDIQRMTKDYALNKISDLVGKVVRMTDKKGRQVYTVITKVAPLTREYQDQTWQKEGWIKSRTDELVGKYPYAIEFKVVSKEEQYITIYTNHSGGAVGSDIQWDIIGREFGVINNKHYWMNNKTPHGNTEITEQDKIEGQKKVTIAARQMGRIEPTHQVRQELLIRNWSQVKYADAIFAITTLQKPGDEMNYGKKALITQAKGGTGYAVQMAINEGKPVYIFDQVRDKWFKNIGGVWSDSEIPILTNNFAGIGTREINAKGKQAIRDVFTKSIPIKNKLITKSLLNLQTEDQSAKIEEILKEEQFRVANYYGGLYKVRIEGEGENVIAVEVVGKYDGKDIEGVPFALGKEALKSIDKILNAYNSNNNGQEKSGRFENTSVSFLNKVKQSIENTHNIFDMRSNQIKYTSDQRIALEKVSAFLDKKIESSMDNYFLLAGYAGTGKTTIAENIVNYGISLVMAPTNKAVKVLKSKLEGKVSAEVRTIHSAIYGGIDETTGQWIASADIKGAYLLIDEASMISEQVLSDLKEAVGPYGKIIFMGDGFQLEPVEKDPKLFTSSMFKSENRIEMTKVMRTSKSPLLSYATYLRVTKKLQVPTTTEGNLKITTNKQEEITNYIKDKSEGKNSIYITATNKNRISINKQVRAALKKQGVLEGTDELMAIGNTQHATNGESFKVEDIKGLPKGELSFRMIPVELPIYKNGQQIWKQETLFLYESSGKSSEEPEYIMLFPHTELASISPQMIEQAWRADKFPVMYKDELENGKEVLRRTGIIATYGYAITAHKSQGSQWDHAYVEQDFAFGDNPARWMYTAVTRAVSGVTLITSNSSKVSFDTINTTISEFIEQIGTKTEEDTINEILTRVGSITSIEAEQHNKLCK